MAPERNLGKNFKEFFGAMKYLSCSTYVDMAKPYSVHPPTMRCWVLGINPPSVNYDKITIDIFGLTGEEIARLRVGSECQQAERNERLLHLEQTVELNTIQHDISARQQLLGSYAVRIERGEPALTEIDQALIQFLIAEEK
jgi:hypothetical protein